MISPARFVAAAMLTFLPITASVDAQDGYPLFRGNAQRSGAAGKSAVAKHVAWQRPLLLDKIPGFDEGDPDQPAKDLIDKLSKGLDPAILPGFFPLIVDGQVVYRSYRDVRSAALHESKPKDDDPIKASEIIWKSVPHGMSLSFLLENPQDKAPLTLAVDRLQARKQELYAWLNPTIGSLSSDGKSAYAIDDFAFPPLAIAKGGADRPFMARLESRIVGNHLYAYDVKSGKILWDTNTPFKGKSAFAETIFLGAPLPFEGMLYALAEKGEELNLLAISLDVKKWKNPHSPQVDRSLVAAKIAGPEQVLKQPLRRAQPLHIAAAGDMLICPTNAGLMIGVDRAKMATRWEYRYRDEGVAARALPFWQAACPIVGKDRIVFTAADSPEIHCIDFAGKKKWAVAEDKDLYLATIHDDLVLMVGKTHCRALNLEDGKEKWTLVMGEPAGVGVKEGSHYYVPLKRDAAAKAAAIGVIDLAKGMMARRVAVPHPEALGNLAISSGVIVSQSMTHIAAYPLAGK